MSTSSAGAGRMTGWAARWLTDELSSLAESGRWDAAIATFSSLTSNSPLVESNVFHYTTVISGCGKANRWEAALTTFASMQRAGIEGNVYTYTSLMDACNRAKPEMTPRIFSYMRRAEVLPNVRSMTSLVKSFALVGKWESALAALKSCDELMISPNVYLYTSVIDACRRTGRWREAVSLLDAMRSVNQTTPSHVTYNAAIAACVPSNAWVAALHVFARMRSDGVLPVEYTRSNLLLLLGGDVRGESAVRAMKTYRPFRHDARGDELDGD